MSFSVLAGTEVKKKKKTHGVWSSINVKTNQPGVCGQICKTSDEGSVEQLESA